MRRSKHMKIPGFRIASMLAIASLALAACAPSSSTSNAKPTSEPAAAPAGAKPAAEAAKPATVAVTNPPTSSEIVDSINIQGKNIEVTYWHQRPQKDQDVLQEMLDQFSASNPYGIKARAEIAGAAYPDVYNKVNAALQAGQPPEVSVAYQNQAAFYRAQNAVIDLNPFIKSTKYGLSGDDLKDYFQTFLDGDANPQFQGERLGFPTQRSMEVMFYNVDWLSQLGYSEPPKDWKTWEEAACKASDAAQNKSGWAF